jgi:hypothetical protein
MVESLGFQETTILLIAGEYIINNQHRESFKSYLHKIRLGVFR